MSACGQCRHWYEQEQAKAPPGPVLLDVQRPEVQRQGECREGPPSVIAIQLPPQAIRLDNGQTHAEMSVRLQARYPILAAEFPACGRFATVEAVKV